MVRQGQPIALVVAFLIGCAFLLMAGASGVQAQASKKEEARCEGTRTIKLASSGGEIVTTNDLPGCPKGGLLLGTDKADAPPARPGLAGQDGDDKIRGLGGSDDIFDGSGDDVVYGGDGDDDVFPDSGNDVIYGGDGNDVLAANDAQRDKLYCGAGRDKYLADEDDYVDSSCETASASAAPDDKGRDVAPVQVFTSSASASPVPIPPSGGPAVLLPTAALLLWSGSILTYAILRRR